MVSRATFTPSTARRIAAAVRVVEATSREGEPRDAVPTARRPASTYTFLARLTSAGATYGFEEVYKASAGDSGWTAVPDGVTGTARNGVAGATLEVDDVVVVQWVPVAGEDDGEYWFVGGGGVDGTAIPEPNQEGVYLRGNASGSVYWDYPYV